MNVVPLLIFIIFVTGFVTLNCISTNDMNFQILKKFTSHAEAYLAAGEPAAAHLVNFSYN